MMQVPMTRKTRHFLGPAEFARMRPGAIVVNTGRGPTIDNKALYEKLEPIVGSFCPALARQPLPINRYAAWR